jgi:hypothetical protein
LTVAVPRREGAVDRVETPHRIVRQSQCIVLDKLPTMSLIGAAWIDNNRRPPLVHQIAAIEVFAKPPNPYQATLSSMVKRLLPALKMVRLDLAADLVESFIVAAPWPSTKAAS